MSSINPFSLLPTTNEKKGMTRIAREVIQCINKDPLYGPRHDKQRRVIGLEHEIMLEQALYAMGKLIRKSTKKKMCLFFFPAMIHFIL